MKLKLEIKTWNWNLKLKLKIETWNWNMHNLKNVIGYYWVWGSNSFLGPTNVYSKFGFWKYSPIFCLYFSTIGVFFAFFLPFRAIFGAGVRFKHFFVTFLYRQSTLVLEVQPYLFLITSIFGASFALFWALRGYFLAL